MENAIEESSVYLNPIAEDICKKRYYQKDENGNPIETWQDLVNRVVNHICKNENDNFKKQICDLMIKTKFLPNSPCLVNAGAKSKSAGYMACFVLPATEDCWSNSEETGMIETIANFGHVARRGGGAGINLSKIRPEGDPVFGSTHAKACGPIEHMRMISEVMNSITQSGFRSMACLACLDVNHPDIFNFIKCKQKERALKTILKEDFSNHYDSFVENTDFQLKVILDKFLHNFNISILVTDDFMRRVENDEDFDLTFNNKVYKTVKAKEIFDCIAENAWKNGDPGLFFYDRINNSPYKYSKQIIHAANPCVVGNTMVAVADGRVAVPIKQLAEEEKDVPVYCRNNKGKITIRMMRRPRISGMNKKILKITIEGGHVLRVTENHKIVLVDNTSKEAKNIQVGDSLSIMNKMKAPIEAVIVKNNKSRSQKYYWIKNSGNTSWTMDHRIIYNFYNRGFGFKDVIHHKDKNALNNAISNLEAMSKKQHDELHRIDKIGDNNPMRRAKFEWSKEKWNDYHNNMSKSVSGLLNGNANPITNENLFAEAVNLSKRLNRKISQTEWTKYSREHNLVCTFTNFRKQKFGSIGQFLTNAAIEAGVENAHLTGSALMEYKRFLLLSETSDLDLFFDGQVIKVKKICEYCKNIFIVGYQQREICFCSRKCVGHSFSQNEKIKIKLKAEMKKRREAKKEALLNTYNKFKSELGRIPMKKEFHLYCKKNGISLRIPTEKERKSGLFIGCFSRWKQLKEEAATYNHKVIKIEYDGEEDVYNGTVDDYHNFYIGHFKEKNNGYENYIYINTLNCGEITNPDGSACDLGSIDISKYYNSENNSIKYKELKEDIMVCVRFLDDVIDVNRYPTKLIENWTKENRPIGLGIMGWADLLLKMKLSYGKKRSLELAEELTKFMDKEAHGASVELAKERGTPKCCKYEELEYRRNITTLSIAPTGTISQLAGCSSGIEPIFSITTVRSDNTGKKIITNPDADKSYFRCAVDPDKKEGREVTYEEHILVQAAFQKYVNNSISKTINMPNSATVKDVKNAYMFAWKNKVKGITIYRDCSKSTQVLNTSDKSVLQVSNAVKRPNKVEADIFRTKALGKDWHIIIGKVNNRPYELFAVNGSQELPETGFIIKHKSRHYSLLNEKEEVLIDNIVKQEKVIDVNIDKETRRFSLELRHGIPPKYIVEQIDKSNDYMYSLSKAISRIFATKYILIDERVQIMCPSCAEKGKKVPMISSGGCWKCSDDTCGYSKCG